MYLYALLIYHIYKGYSCLLSYLEILYPFLKHLTNLTTLNAYGSIIKPSETKLTKRFQMQILENILLVFRQSYLK